MKLQEETIGSVLDKMVDDYIVNLRENGSIRKPNIKNLVKVYKPAKKDLRDLLQDYNIFLRDVTDAIDEKNEDVVEAWDFLNKTKLNHLRDFVENVSSFLEENSKIKRRRKRVKPEILVKNVQYKERVENFESVDPVKIIGSKYLVCYNLKYDKVAFYEATDELSVKGTTVQGFDPEKSFVKSVGRSKLTYKSIAAMGINSIKSELLKIKAKNLPATGRINSDTLLLRVSR